MTHQRIPNSEREAKAMWQADASLRAEFGTLERWIAYCKGTTIGRCKQSGRNAYA